MFHVRVVSPTDLTDQVAQLVTDSPATFDMTLARQASLAPATDVVEFMLVREGANAVIDQLRGLGLADHGSIVMMPAEIVISAAADAAEAAVPGRPEDAVVWDELAAKTHEDAQLSWSFLAFFAMAVILGGIGVVLAEPILIVAAMVVGPEFGAIAAVNFGLARGELRRAGSATTNLLIGFAFAIAVTTLLALAGHELGWVDATMLESRTRVAFFVHPDRWSFVVALIAGIAGTLSITSEKSTSLVGVFISIATIPAAANIAVSLALTDWDEVARSFAQLSLNLAGLLLAGTVTFLVQRILWKRFGLVVPISPATPAQGTRS
ncbi:MAG TPA: DUF389 domain-containing protein [Jiangellaceae bacterium]